MPVCDRRYWKNLPLWQATVYIFLLALTISLLVQTFLMFLHPERAVQLMDYLNLPPLYISNFTCVSPCNNYSHPISFDDGLSCDNDVYLVILVLSSPMNIKQRNSIRKTWGSMENLDSHKIQVVFVVGAPVYSPIPLNELYKSEQNQFKDLLIMNVADSYMNLTKKTIGALQWSQAHCPSSAFIMKTDDDSFNVPDHILTELRKIDPHSDFLAGECASGIKPFRDPRHKWYVSETSYPGTYFPLYLRGRGYILTHTAISKLLKASPFVIPNTMEDVFLTGMCRLKAGIPASCWSGFAITQEGSEVDQCVVLREDLMNIHHVTHIQMEAYWRVIRDKTEKSNTCSVGKSFLHKHLKDLYDAFSFE